VAGAVTRERRASARLSGSSMPGMDRARLRPGRTAHIVDLSAGGALIETDWRLLPGVRVEIQVGEPVPLFRVSGRILRCHVALLGRERIRYRGALMFEEQVPIGEGATPAVEPDT
jgi:PilZ domain